MKNSNLFVGLGTRDPVSEPIIADLQHSADFLSNFQLKRRRKYWEMGTSVTQATPSGRWRGAAGI